MAHDVSVNDFGLVIAYLLPGFTAVWGTALAVGVIDRGALTQDSLSVGGFLYTTLVSLGAGLALSTLRWLLIDHLHHATGIRRPTRNFAALAGNVEAYTFLNDAHYRYYQHAAGMLLAVAWVYAVWRWAEPLRPAGLPDLGVLALLALYYVGSRDALRKFYLRTNQLLTSPPGTVREREAKAPSGVSQA